MDDGEGLATFGVGCFWCAEVSFDGIDGIDSIRVGFMGGTKEYPTYEEVCSGDTNHIEVVQIRFDRNKVTFKELMEVFWNSHNPVVGPEGNGDSGIQYRSAVFFHSDEQRAIAEDSKRRVQGSGRFRGRISTLILPASRFWLAEEHHQCYIRKLQKNKT
jgi:peptide-methionine (S)-S-oxide reductase